MSRSDAVSFVQQCFEDPALQERVTQAGDAGVAGIAGELGLSVAPEEFQGVIDEIQEQVGERELSEEDLDAVAGGYPTNLSSATQTMSSWSKTCHDICTGIISNM